MDVPEAKHALPGHCYIQFDSQGNLILDEFTVQNKDKAYIRKFSPQSGRIAAIAGTGNPGFSGDGGPASQAAFGFCGGIAADSNGNLFINDQSNGRIRKIDEKSVVTTIAGKGTNDPYTNECKATDASIPQLTGIAVDSRGNVFFGDGNRVRMVDPKGILHTVAGTGEPGSKGDGKEANLAKLTGAHVLGVDSADSVYVWESNKVRKLTLKK